MAKLVSVNVGLPKEVQWRGQRVYTGIWKQPVDGDVSVRRLNLAGDGQGDLAGHGGEHRAVFVYQTSSYDFWARKLRRSDFTMGQFGENFTVEGLPDAEVRIGDRFRIGGATFEVTQPRVTCYRVGIRLNDAHMPSRLVAEGLPGFYFRVLEEGSVRAGDAIELLSRNPASVTVADVDALLYRPGGDREMIRRALDVPALSAGWHTSLQAILDEPAGASGNAGLAPAGLAPNSQRGFRSARIAALTRVTADVLSVGLEAPDGSDLDAARPGQFVAVKANVPAASATLIRSYSIAGTPNAKRYELGVKCERDGAMGRYLSQAKVGDRLEISAPRGAFVLRATERPVVFVSAGIGITPVLAMLRALVAQRSSRRVWWLYGARNGEEHPFAREVRTLVARLANAGSHVWYSLSVRPHDVRRRSYGGTGGDRYSARRHFRRSFRHRAGARSRNRRLARRGPARAPRSSGYGPDRVVLAKRLKRAMGHALRESSRFRRSLRRARAMVVSQRSLPYLRKRFALRRRDLRTAAPAAARRRERSALLLDPERRPGSGPLRRELRMRGEVLSGAQRLAVSRRDRRC
jgi:MOSC domain-containing protein YiiM/ferredoxin-NADP reductase